MNPITTMFLAVYYHSFIHNSLDDLSRQVSYESYFLIIEFLELKGKKKEKKKDQESGDEEKEIKKENEQNKGTDAESSVVEGKEPSDKVSFLLFSFNKLALNYILEKKIR